LQYLRAVKIVMSHVGSLPSREKSSLPDLGYRSARTELGRKLQEIRSRIVAGGQPLLVWEEFDREVGERRGEPENAE
jgi:chorismate-pyruvate lyase